MPRKASSPIPGSRGPGKGCGKEPPTSVKRTDLEPGVRYEVLVQALSGDGFGEWSDMKTAPRTIRGRALGARFVSPPERHDGEKRIKVRVAFSEAPENVGADGVEVEGGAVTSVRPVGGDAPGGAGTGSKSRSIGNRDAGQQDREVVWEFEIEPDSDGDVTVSLDAGRPCDEEGAICTADGRSLSEGISTTVEGPDTGPPPLTASFEDLPEAHDGESAFRFRLAFSERIAISFRSLREDAFEVTGGRVTRGKRVDGRKDLFEITVEPDGAGEVSLSLPAGRECSVSGAICTWGPPRKQLTNTPAATVAGPAVETGPASLTASFVDVPAEHDGESAFTFRIAFSERVGWMNGRRLREHVVAVSGGRATSASRVDRRRDLWQVTVEPDSLADVTVALSAGAACRTPAAVCTSDGRALSNSISATVRGPVTVSVADARAEEGADESIDFAVTLSRAASGTVEVSYATADGTATAGADYTRTGGELRFAPGETAKTVSVPVLDDVVDEGEETFTLRLTNASGARIADGTATGTIENSDPLQKMWLSRFGRTVAGQVVDAVAGRLSGPTGGSQVTLGGQSIDLSSLSADSVDARRTLAGALGAAEEDDPLAGPGPLEAARAGSWDDPETGGTVRSLTGRELLLGSSFHLAAGGGEAGGPGYAAWGRIAVGGFDAEAPGREGHGAPRRRGDDRNPGRRRPMGALARGRGALGERGRGQLRPAGRGHGHRREQPHQCQPLCALRGERPALGLGPCGLRHRRHDDDAGGARGSAPRPSPAPTSCCVSARPGRGACCWRQARTAASTWRCAATRSWCRWSRRRRRTRSRRRPMRAGCAWCWRPGARSRSARARC